MSEINFLKWFKDKSAYESEKDKLPYPSISLTEDDGELYLSGNYSKRTVKVSSNTSDGIITITDKDGKEIEVPLVNGKANITLEDGVYTYKLTKGSIKDEPYLNVSPTTLSYATIGGDKTINYTAYTKVYDAFVTGTFTVDGSALSETIDITSKNNAVTLTTSNFNLASFITVKNITSNTAVLTASQNIAPNDRTGSVVISNASVSKTVSIEQSGKSITATTYDIINLTPISSASTVVEYNTNTQTIAFSGVTITHYSDGTESSANTPVSETVTSATNNSSAIIGIAGNVTWNGVSKRWEFGKHGAKEVKPNAYQYEITAIVPNSTATSVPYNTTAYTVNYTGTTYTELRDGSRGTVYNTTGLTKDVTFPPNDTTESKTVTGSVVWNGDTKVWTLSQNVGQVPTGTTYNISNITPNSSATTQVSWDTTSYTVRYTGQTITHYADGTTAVTKTDALTETVNFGTNTGSKLIVRSGEITWNGETARWELGQKINGGAVSATTYSIKAITPNSSATTVVEYDVTGYTVNYTGVTTEWYFDETSNSTETPLTKDITFTVNQTKYLEGIAGNITWNGETARYELGQHGAKEVKPNAYQYEITSVIPNSTATSVPYNTTAYTVNYTGITYNELRDGSRGTVYATTSLTKDVEFAENGTTSPKTVTGNVTWNGDTKVWTLSQTANPKQVTATTYTISNITPNSSASTVVAYNATSYAVKYTGQTISHYLDGSTAITETSLTETVTLTTNTGSTVVGRSGEITWNGENARWELGQHGAKEPSGNYTYKITAVSPNSSATTVVAWDTTSYTVNYTGATYHIYLDGTTATTAYTTDTTLQEVVDNIEPNNTAAPVGRSGEITWNGDKARWELGLNKNGGVITATTYNISNINPKSTDIKQPWNATSVTVNYTGQTISHYADGTTAVTKTEPLTESVNISTNTTDKEVTREGDITWNGETAHWKTSQLGGKQPSGNYDYKIKAVSPTSSASTVVAWDTTEYTVNYTGEIYVIYNDNTTASTPSSTDTGLTKTITLTTNTGTTVKGYDGNVTWNGKSARYEFGQHGAKEVDPSKTTYSIIAISPNSSANTVVAYNATEQTVSYTGRTTTVTFDGTSSNNDTDLTKTITLTTNTSTTVKGYGDNITWQDKTARYEFGQHGAKEVDPSKTTYAVVNVVPNSSANTVVAYNATAQSVTYSGRTTTVTFDGTSSNAYTGLSMNVPLTTNTGNSVKGYDGNVTSWQDKTARYEFGQHGAKEQSGATFYSVTNVVAPDSPVNYDVTSTTVTYSGNTLYKTYDNTTLTASSTGLSETVYFAQNTGTSAETRTGKTTPWNGQSATWTVVQNPNSGQVTATTYEIINVTPTTATTPIEYNTTSVTVTFTGVTWSHYLNGSKVSAGTQVTTAFTVSQNTGSTTLIRTGDVTWNTATKKTWSQRQYGAKEVRPNTYQYEISGVSAPETVAWDATSVTVTYSGVTYAELRDGSRGSVTNVTTETTSSKIDQNTGKTAVTRSGNVTWQTATAKPWSTSQQPGSFDVTFNSNALNGTVTTS